MSLEHITKGFVFYEIKLESIQYGPELTQSV